MKKLLSATTIVASLFLSTLGGASTAIANTSEGVDKLTFSEFAVHPYASKSGYTQGVTNSVGGVCQNTFCPAGQIIHDMEITEDGKLIAGYGDWNGNSDSWGAPEGRVGIVPLDLKTKTWEPIIYSGTESHDVVRKYNNHLYLPTTDPSRHAPAGNTRAASGFMTNDSGQWRFVNTGSALEMTHTFDVAVDKDGNYWVFGSMRVNGVPSGVVLNSTDNGKTFKLVESVTSDDSSIAGWERNYWGSANSKAVFTSTTDVISSDKSKNKIRAFTDEGKNILDETNETYYPTSVINFKDKVLMATQNELREIKVDGVSTLSTLPEDYYRDFTVYNNELYLLSRSGNIYKSSDAVNWVAIPTEARAAFTLVIHDDYLYIGGDEGKIFRSNETMSELRKFTELSSSIKVVGRTDTNKNNLLDVGDVLTITHVVENAGNIVGENLTIKSKYGSPSIKNSISPGEKITTTWDYKITDNDYDGSASLPIEVLVTSTDSAGKVDSSLAKYSATLGYNSRIVLEDTNLILDKDNDSNNKINVGDSVKLRTSMTNFHRLDLQDIQIESVPNVNWTCSPNNLKFKEKTTCTSDSIMLTMKNLGENTYNFRGRGTTENNNKSTPFESISFTVGYKDDVIIKNPESNDVKGEFVNPSGTKKVTVPTLSGVDNDGNTLSRGMTFKVSNISSNGKLYYENKRLYSNSIVTNYDPSKLAFDPNDEIRNAIFYYSVQDQHGQWDLTPAKVELTFTTPAKSSLSGEVVNDKNRDGKKNVGEGISGVTVTLKGNDGSVRTAVTNSDGVYKFSDLNESVTYSLTESQPFGYLNLHATVGGVGRAATPNMITSIKVLGGEQASGYDFYEWSLVYK